MLHQTVKRVLRFAAKGLKSQEKFRSVRWLPASETPGLGFSEGSWVMAYDGTVGVACHVEDVLPSVLLPTDGVRQALAANTTRTTLNLAGSRVGAAGAQAPAWSPRRARWVTCGGCFIALRPRTRGARRSSTFACVRRVPR